MGAARRLGEGLDLLETGFSHHAGRRRVFLVPIYVDLTHTKGGQARIHLAKQSAPQSAPGMLGRDHHFAHIAMLGIRAVARLIAAKLVGQAIRRGTHQLPTVPCQHRMRATSGNVPQVRLNTLGRQPVPGIGPVRQNQVRQGRYIDPARRCDSNRHAQAFQPCCISHWLLAPHSSMAA